MAAEPPKTPEKLDTPGPGQPSGAAPPLEDTPFVPPPIGQQKQPPKPDAPAATKAADEQETEQAKEDEESSEEVSDEASEEEDDSESMGFLNVREGEYSNLLGSWVSRISYQSRDAIVFLNKELIVCVQVSDDYGPYTDECVAIWPDLKIAESKPVNGISESDNLKYRVLIGKALAQVVEKDATPTLAAARLEGARRILAQAESLRSQRLAEISRLWYLTSSLLWLALGLFVALVIWLSRDWVSPRFGPHVVPAANCCAFGLVGAMTSILQRLGRVQASPEAGRQIHWVESCARLAIGAIAAVIVYLCIGAGVILKDIAGASQPLLTFVVAFVAGMSERALVTLASQTPGGLGKDLDSKP